MYINSAKVRDGGLGEPWNLEDVEDKQMILSDKILDNTCQLRIEPNGIHNVNLYGDLVLVNGVPWPRMPIDPKWVRFRFLDTSISRPFLLQVRDANAQEVSSKICKVIATDGGFRPTAAPFPATGLLIGVAERYEVVCDFTGYAGQTLYWWNDLDPVMQSGVPMFCYSHLISRIEVSSTPVVAPAFDETAVSPYYSIFAPTLNTFTQSDLDLAVSMANSDVFHRHMVFERRNGHWVINGETWDTFKIAAADVGQNVWELWKFTAGGGWFHPVHMHLVDFYMVRRNGGHGEMAYEQLSPKDVFYLGPGNNVYLLVRFGAHKGSYMFHCHNLIHEDDDMLRAFTIVDTSAGAFNQDTAKPFVSNPMNGIIYSKYDYSDPMFGDVCAKPTDTLPTFDAKRAQTVLDLNLYRIFYPTPDDIAMYPTATNVKGIGDITGIASVAAANVTYYNPWESEWKDRLPPL